MIFRAAIVAVIVLLSGIAIGYNTATRSTTSPEIVDNNEKTSTPKPPPVEASVAEVVVGSLQGASALALPPITITRSSTPSKPTTPSRQRFFDFSHAMCDEVESVRGQVLRCSRTR